MDGWDSYVGGWVWVFWVGGTIHNQVYVYGGAGLSWAKRIKLKIGFHNIENCYL